MGSKDSRKVNNDQRLSVYLESDNSLQYPRNPTNNSDNLYSNFVL